jgi:hypothetical protein
MKGVYVRRISTAKIGASVQGLEQWTLRAKRTRLITLSLVVGLTAGVLAVLNLVAPPDVGVIAVVFATIGLLLFGFWFFSWRTAQKEIAARRVRPLCTILAALRDDLLPTRKLRMRYDLRAPNHKEKMTWTQTSDHGHAKIRYYDPWLRLKGMLADGTRFRVRMNSELKTKKGRVLHEKRWLYLKLMPPADRYSIDQAAEHFHLLVSAFDNEPALSGSAVVLQIAIDQLRGSIVIKARREDQDFKPEALLGIMRGTVGFLIAHGRGAPDAEVA